MNDSGWEEMVMYVDGAATETVAPEKCIASVVVKVGVAPRRDVQYGVANGVRIPTKTSRTLARSSGCVLPADNATSAAEAELPPQPAGAPGAPRATGGSGGGRAGARR